MLKPTILAVTTAAVMLHGTKAVDPSDNYTFTGTERHYGVEVHYGPSYEIGAVHFRGGAFIEADPNVGAPALWLSQGNQTVGVMYAFQGGGFNFYTGTNIASGYDASKVVTLNNGTVYANAVAVNGGVLLNPSEAPTVLEPGQSLFWSDTNGIARVTTCSRAGVVRTKAIAGEENHSVMPSLTVDADSRR
jgi:hypothetical protein